MSFHKWGFVYLGLGSEDPAKDRAVIEAGGLTTTVVAVPDRASAARVAAELVADGAQSIELCGAFTAADTARVIDAVGDRVPVGSVTYASDAIPALAALFAPSA
jgi:hypothetical protein